MAHYDTGPYEALVAGWKSICVIRDVRLREVACVGDAAPLLLAETGPPDAPAIQITAGVHGDEPAGPWALHSMVRDGLLDPRFAYRLWPCTNPAGYAAGTRGNAAGDDVNRSFSRDGTTPESRAIVETTGGRRFVLALDLHEDFEAEGFYCYEPVIDGEAPYGRAVLAAIEAAGFSLQALDRAYDLGYPSHAGAEKMRVLELGRVLVNPAAESRHFKGLPLSLFMLQNATDRYVTMETPRRRAWDDRIAMHRVGVTAALTEAAALRFPKVVDDART